MASEQLLPTENKRQRDADRGGPGDGSVESPKRSGCLLSCFEEPAGTLYTLDDILAGVQCIRADAHAGQLMPTEDTHFVQHIRPFFGELTAVYDGETEVVGEGNRGSGLKERYAVYASIAHMHMAVGAADAKKRGDTVLLGWLVEQLATMQYEQDTLLGNQEPECFQTADTLVALSDAVLEAIEGGAEAHAALVTLAVHDYEKLVDLREYGTGPARTAAKLEAMRCDGCAALMALPQDRFDDMLRCFGQGIETAQSVQGEKSGADTAATYSAAVPAWFSIHCLFDTSGILVNLPIPNMAYFRSPLLTPSTCDYFLGLAGKCAAATADESASLEAVQAAVRAVYNEYVIERTLGALDEPMLAVCAASLAVVDAAALRHALGRLVCLVRTANPATVRDIQILFGAACERYGESLMAHLVRALGEAGGEPPLLKYAPKLLNDAAKKDNTDEFLTALAALAAVCAVGPFPCEAREICLNRLANRKPTGTPAQKAWYCAWARVAALGAPGADDVQRAVTDAVACARYADLATRPDGAFVRAMREHSNVEQLFAVDCTVVPTEQSWQDGDATRTALVFPSSTDPSAITIRTLRESAQEALHTVSIAMFARGMQGDDTVLFALLATFAMHADGFGMLSDPYANDIDDVAVLAMVSQVDDWAKASSLYVPQHTRAFFNDVRDYRAEVDAMLKQGTSLIEGASLTQRCFGGTGGAMLVAAKPCDFPDECASQARDGGVVYIQGEHVMTGSKPYSNGRGATLAGDEPINRYVVDVAAKGCLVFLNVPRARRKVSARLDDGGALQIVIADDAARDIVHSIVGGARDSVEVALVGMFAAGGFVTTPPMLSATAGSGNRSYLADVSALMIRAVMCCEGVM